MTRPASFQESSCVDTAAMWVLLASASVLMPADEVDVPPLNAAVLRFCEAHDGTQVGNGSCAAVASRALSAAGAKTRGFDPALDDDGAPVWGTPVEHLDDVRPGDVIQFSKVRLLDLRPNGTRYIRIYPQHTAIVARVRGGGMFDLYEQNVSTAGSDAKRRGQLRKRDVNFRGVLEGTIRAYRPQAE